MAVTTGQSRWRNNETWAHRITRSAKVLGRSTFTVDPVPGRVGEDLRNAVSPHWKRVSAGCSTLTGRTDTASAALDDVKVRRAALLVSDFRFVNRSRSERSARLEKEFERFANSFGGEATGGLGQFQDLVGKEENSKGKHKSEGNESKGVRFANETQQSWDVGFWEEMQNGFQDVNSRPWSAPIPQPTTTMIPTRQPRSLQEPCETGLNNGTWTRVWEEGDDNSLYRNLVEDMVSTSRDDVQTILSSDGSSQQAMYAESAVFIEELAIPDEETKHKAIERLKTVERHLSLSQDPIIISDRDSISSQDEHPLHDSLDRAPKLLSASLDTLLSDNGSGTSFFFYCPHLACHQRLVHQNARLPRSQKERSCVHTECSYVSHDLEGWIKHCNTLHHEYVREGHENCGFHCYSNEDTH